MRKNVHGSTLLLKKNWKQSKCRQTEWNLSNSEISLSSMEKKKELSTALQPIYMNLRKLGQVKCVV